MSAQREYAERSLKTEFYDSVVRVSHESMRSYRSVLSRVERGGVCDVASTFAANVEADVTVAFAVFTTSNGEGNQTR